MTKVEPYTANFVFFTACGRLMHFVFWLSSYHELNDKYASTVSGRYPGHLVVLSQVVNLLLMGDYVYYYLVSAKNQKPVVFHI